ncbi:MAG: RNA-directed DNA polymerase [Bacteroidota bacterium]
MMQPLDKIKLACQIIQQFKERNTLTIDYPFENKWIESADDVTLLNTYYEITSPAYVPSSAETIDVPKSGGLIRHFSYLTLKDHLLYILLSMDCFPTIYKSIYGRLIDDPDTVLKKYPEERLWMKKFVRGGKDMMEMRKPLFNKGYNCILTSDITAFGPNIDIRILCEELIKEGAPEETVGILDNCLRKWSPLGYKGVPQVFFATDLLTEFYLQPIDRFFHSYGGLVYLRESDNIEIWCRSRSSCKQMLAILAGKMYERGLYLNVYKTRIVTEKSIDRNEHPMEHKKYGLRNSFKIRFTRVLSLYYKLEEMALLNECSKRLAKNPEFTVALLKHYASFNIDISRSLMKFLTSGNAIYPYQNYAIIKWLSLNYQTHNPLLIEIIRQFAWNDNEPYYLRSAARHYIYSFGNDNDRERLIRLVKQTNSELEKEDILSMLSGRNTATSYKI